MAKKPAKLKPTPSQLERAYDCAVTGCKAQAPFRIRNKDTDVVTGYCRNHLPEEFGMEKTFSQRLEKLLQT